MTQAFHSEDPQQHRRDSSRSGESPGKRPHSFRTVLVGHLLPLTALFLCALGLLLSLTSGRIATHTIHRHYRQQTLLLADRLGDMLQHAAREAAMLGRAPRDTTDGAGFWTVLLRLTTDGRRQPLAGAAIASALPETLWEQPFVHDARQLQQPAWSAPFVATDRNDPLLAVALPQGDGLLVGVLRLARLHDQLTATLANSQLSLLDAHDLWLLPGLPGLPAPAPGTRPDWRRRPNTTQVGLLIWDSTPLLASTARIRGQALQVLLTRPRSRAYAPVYRIYRTGATLTLGALLLALPLGLWISRRLSAPLQAFSRRAPHLAQEAVTLDLPSPNYREILELVSALQTMLSTLRQRQEDLSRSREHYQQLFHLGRDALLVHALSSQGEPGLLLEANEPACRLLGRSAAELRQQTLLDLLPPEEGAAHAVLSAMPDLTEGASRHFETHLRHASGLLIPVEIDVHLFRQQDQMRVMSIIRDIRERDQTQRALSALVASFVETTGERAFFRILKELGTWLGCQGVLIATLEPNRQLRPLAALIDDQQQDLALQPLAGTPSERVLEYGHLFYPDHISYYFPEDRILRSWQARGYIGLALRDSRDSLLGVMVAFSRQPLALPNNAQEILHLLATKAASEIERMRASDSLRTALKVAEEARERVRAIIESLSDGLLVIDPDGRIILLNQAAAALLGLRPEDAQGRPCEQVIRHPAFATHLQHVLLAPQGEGSAEFDVKPETGPVRLVVVKTLPLVIAGRPSGHISLLRDVTRERESDRLKNEFIATAAHELKTPMTTIIGFADLLAHEDEYGPFTEEQRQEYLADICAKTETLSQIVEDLLDLGRMTTGRPLRLNRCKTDLGQLIHQAIAEHRIQTRHHVFEVLTPATPLLLDIDGTRMMQVLDNLLANAVKYSPTGGTIRVNLAADDEGVQLVIADEGIGIAPADLAHIFDKFYRAATHDTTGLGLGLSISKGIIDAHGGHIRAESTPGLGTRIFIDLPL